jgi:hypothetical protein
VAYDREYAKKYYQRHKKRINRRTKSYLKDNPEKWAKHALAARASKLRTKYGITLEQYDKALGEQGGVCAICLKPPKKNRLAVDHLHKPPYRVRGLLCNFCNHRLLGRGRERPELHDRAAAYLRSDRDLRLL